MTDCIKKMERVNICTKIVWRKKTETRDIIEKNIQKLLTWVKENKWIRNTQNKHGIVTPTYTLKIQQRPHTQTIQTDPFSHDFTTNK